jgi:large subunit ribosomal protein L9
MAGNVHVILARDVPNLGRVGELVRVRPGYARNYLVP